ncbi:MAG: carbamoyl phosphate synthase small subunit [Hydrogeniiclostridium sp.]
MEQTVYIVLENGTVFEGKNFGAPIDSVTGEMVFTTSMTGYLETLSDPSYWGQIVVQTFPLIGNYGVIPSDFESSALWPSAYIVREWCQSPSNFRSEGDLDTFFKEKGFPAVYGVDTRSLTRILREHGAMNGWITAKAPPYSQTELFAMKSYAVKEAVPHVTVSEPKSFPAQGAELHHVVLWDFGSKNNIRRELCRRGCRVTVLPASSQAEDILSFSPDGVMLSNGPGDPAENTDIIRELQKLCGSGVPIFGICLGHQLLALANGARTEKLKYGHRGANQPVKDVATGRVYITSQNHGYAVSSSSLPDGIRTSFCNLNDGTCEGLEYDRIPAFSVQFHPEACGGPLDTRFLFDRFIEKIEAFGKMRA